MKSAAITWHQGQPPSIGWWPASVERDPDAFRWWNGTAWSWPAFAHEDWRQVALAASVLSTLQARIEWTDRPADWPERSKT